MDAGTAIRIARESAGLSKRELARRAHTSPAAIVAYESQRQDPSWRTLQRILQAAGTRAELLLRANPVDPIVSGRRLAEVLELAEHLPHRPASRRLSYPVFPA